MRAARRAALGQVQGRHGILTCENIAFHIDVVALPGSLKFIGLSHKGFTVPFSNISAYHDRYSALVPNKTQPHADVAMFTNLPDGSVWDYIFGEQVNSLDEIPDGLAGIDTCTRRFEVMRFRAGSMFKLVGDTEPGEAMQTTGRYINEIWLPQHRGIAITDEKGECGKVIKDGRMYHRLYRGIPDGYR